VFGGKINSLGFRDREVNREKEKGVRRVICMGDSVTAQGQPCYAQYLHQMLTNAPPDGGKWEAISMGVYGYSSMQGLRSFDLLGKSLKPDVVIVSFGRNDHVWEIPDRTRLGARLSPTFRTIYMFLSNRTIGRMFLHVFDVRHQWTATKPKGPQADSRELRLPPEDFRITMRQFVKEIRSCGATPILVTAARRRIPENYVTKGCARTRDEFERQHDEYAQIVRDVAQETDTTLVDLQKLMAGPECDSWFASDAIHLDFYDSEGRIEPWSREQPGLRFVARSMYDAISTLK
jgi:lysophospholipase L1-like esterase